LPLNFAPVEWAKLTNLKDGLELRQ
jgi:hypothetical protein